MPACGLYNPGLTMYVSHERALVRMQASADKVSCDKTLAEQAATACRASSRRGREGSDHRWRHVSRDTAACLVMVAVIFVRCQSFLLTAALLVVGLIGGILYGVIVLLQRVDRTNIAIGSIANKMCFDQVPGGV